MGVFLLGILLLLVAIIFLLLKSSLLRLYEALTIFIYKGAPYVVTDDKKLKIMMELADLKRDDCVADLGSGDGKVVFEAAKKVQKVTGYEINPFVIKKAIKKLHKKYKKYSEKVAFKKRNFLTEDLSGYNVVFVYGIGYLMRDLENKLNKELKKGSRVVSNYYKFPGWKAKENVGGVYLYTKSK